MGTAETSAPDALLTIPQAAEYLNCSIETIRRRIRLGQLSACRTGPRLIRIKRYDLDAHAAPIARTPATDLEEHIRRVVDAAPVLSNEQRTRLAALFAPAGGGRR